MSETKIIGCMDCSYDLQGIVGRRCPECGRPFDPERPETFVFRMLSGRKFLAWQVVAWLLFLLPILSWFGRSWLAFDSMIWGLLVVAGLICLSCALWISYDNFKQGGSALRRAPGSIKEPLSMRAAFVLSIGGLVVSAGTWILLIIIVVVSQ